MSDWRTGPLGSFVEFQRGIDITKTAQRSGPIPVVSSGGISSFHSSAHTSGPGVVIGRKGTLGKAFYVPGPYWPHDTTLWVRDFKGNHPKFVYYFMSKFDVSWLDAGSANPTLNRNHLHPIVVSWPPASEQQAIAEVLGALDDKIAANTALAAAADALVRAEYGSFPLDATRTVASVANAPRVAVDPGSLAPSTTYVGLEHVPRRVMWLGDAGTAQEVTSGKSRFESGDVLFGKLRPYFHKVVSAPVSGVCSTDMLVVRAKDAALASLVLAALSSDEVVAQVVAASEGTRMPRTSWKDLAAASIRWPAPEDVHTAASRVDAIRNAVIVALAENRTLAATRDALLPQLMSGKLRVRDAEAAASAAGA